MRSIPEIVALAAVLCALASPALACGHERWNVKIARDRDAGLVRTTPKPTTIAALDHLTPPSDPDARPRSRWAPTEATIYRVGGTISDIRHEQDEDYHIVLYDGSAHMIVEVPKPSCAEGSLFLADIEKARAETAKLSIGQSITVTGIGFFDRIHGQEGVAPNGIELHPVLAISGARAKPIPVYPYTEAPAHIGERASVRGTLVSVYTSPRGTVFLDFCADYRTCPFSGVIFADNAEKFGDLSRYVGKTVTLTGVISSYRGRAEIKLSSPSQFAVSE